MCVEQPWLFPPGCAGLIRALAEPQHRLPFPHHSQLIFCTGLVSNISSYPFFGINLKLCIYHFPSASALGHRKTRAPFPGAAFSSSLARAGRTRAGGAPAPPLPFLPLRPGWGARGRLQVSPRCSAGLEMMLVQLSPVPP